MRCWAQSNYGRANASTAGLVTATLRLSAATTRLIEPIAPRMDSSGKCVVVTKAVRSWGGRGDGWARQAATNDKFYRALASAAQRGAGAGAADAEGWNLQFSQPSPRTTYLVFPVLVLPGYIVAGVSKQGQRSAKWIAGVCVSCRHHYGVRDEQLGVRVRVCVSRLGNVGTRDSRTERRSTTRWISCKVSRMAMTMTGRSRDAEGQGRFKVKAGRTSLDRKMVSAH